MSPEIRADKKPNEPNHARHQKRKENRGGTSIQKRLHHWYCPDASICHPSTEFSGNGVYQDLATGSLVFDEHLLDSLAILRLQADILVSDK